MLTKLKKYLLPHEKTSISRIVIIFFIGSIFGFLINSTQFTINKIIEEKYFLQDKPFNVEETIRYFPLKKGNFWKYEGTYREQIVDGGAKIYSGSYILTESVINEYLFENIYLYKIERVEEKKGLESKITYPGYLIKGNKVFLLADKKFQLVKNFLGDLEKSDMKGSEGSINFSEYKDSDFINDGVYDNIQYEFPLIVGVSYGAPYFIRTDNMYTNYVNDKIKVKIPSVNQDCFELKNDFLGSENTELFCPYIGIVKQHYKHFGTVIEFDLLLTDYFISD